jgi:hypothetical protein
MTIEDKMLEMQWYPNLFKTKKEEVEFWREMSEHYDQPLSDDVKEVFKYIDNKKV